MTLIMQLSTQQPQPRPFLVSCGLLLLLSGAPQGSSGLHFRQKDSMRPPSLEKADCDGYEKEDCERSVREGFCSYNEIEEECQKNLVYVPPPAPEPTRAQCAAIGTAMGKCNAYPGCEFDGSTGACRKKPKICAQVKCTIGLTCTAHFMKITPDGACCPICMAGESFYKLPHPIIQSHIKLERFKKGGTYRYKGLEKVKKLEEEGAKVVEAPPPPPPPPATEAPEEAPQAPEGKKKLPIHHGQTENFSPPAPPSEE